MKSSVERETDRSSRIGYVSTQLLQRHSAIATALLHPRLTNPDSVVGRAQAALRLPTALIVTDQNLRGNYLPEDRG
jgi:hypothetical protein